MCSAVTMEVMAVTCQEAEHLVTPYINDELTGDETEAFLAHIESCRNCQEELEIYFMVDVGLKQLDKGYGTFDIAGRWNAESRNPIPGYTGCGCSGHLSMQSTRSALWQ